MAEYPGVESTFCLFVCLWMRNKEQRNERRAEIYYLPQESAKIARIEISSPKLSAIWRLSKLGMTLQVDTTL